MDLAIPAEFVILLIILSACLSILRCLSTDISHAHAVVDLTAEVKRKRERYLAELRGKIEPGEVEIIEEDNE